jgi:Plexin repeat
MRRAWIVAVVLASCIGSGEPNCAQYAECGTCVMEDACGWCFETNLCIPDGQTCPGDRAQTPDMCDGE